jgi:outer membrane lipoprotein SlyB
LFSLLISAPVLAQSSQTYTAPPSVTPGTQTPSALAATGLAWSPAQSINLFAFARNGQTSDQQLKDESECYGAAKQMSRVDPQTGTPTAPSVEELHDAQLQAAQNAEQVQGGRAKGALRGAAGGAAIGGIAGNAGAGAGAGAVAGMMRGGANQRAANAQSQQKAAAEAKAKLLKEHDQQLLAHKEGLDTFQRAFIACMDARNYSVK